MTRLRLARRSLILRLVGLSLLLLLIVKAAGFAVVRASIDRTARAQIARALDLDENIWRRLLDQNAEQLRQGSALLAADYGFRAALQDGFVVVCRPQHPLTRQATVTAAELLAQRWLAPPLTGLGPQQVESLFDELGGVPDLCRVSSRSTEIMFAMLADSDMLACAPASLVRPLVQREELAVVPWNSQAVGPLGVLAKAEVLAHQTHPSQSFITHVLAVGGGLSH